MTRSKRSATVLRAAEAETRAATTDLVTRAAKSKRAKPTPAAPDSPEPPVIMVTKPLEPAPVEHDEDAIVINRNRSREEAQKRLNAMKTAVDVRSLELREKYSTTIYKREGDVGRNKSGAIAKSFKDCVASGIYDLDPNRASLRVRNNGYTNSSVYIVEENGKPEIRIRVLGTKDEFDTNTKWLAAMMPIAMRGYSPFHDEKSAARVGKNPGDPKKDVSRSFFQARVVQYRPDCRYDIWEEMGDIKGEDLVNVWRASQRKPEPTVREPKENHRFRISLYMAICDKDDGRFDTVVKELNDAKQFHRVVIEGKVGPVLTYWPLTTCIQYGYGHGISVIMEKATYSHINQESVKMALCYTACQDFVLCKPVLQVLPKAGVFTHEYLRIIVSNQATKLMKWIMNHHDVDIEDVTCWNHELLLHCLEEELMTMADILLRRYPMDIFDDKAAFANVKITAEMCETLLKAVDSAPSNKQQSMAADFKKKLQKLMDAVNDMDTDSDED